MLFTELLKKYGLTEETVSHSLKVKIKRYNKFVTEIEKEKTKLTEAKTAKAKVNSENEIKKGEEYLSSLNEEICNGIDNFAANIELNKRKAENLKNTRAAKGKNKERESAAPVEGTPTGEEPPTEEEKPEEQVETVETTPTEEEVVATAEEPVKKKKSAWGWVVGIGLILLTGGAIAYNHFKNKE